MIDVMHRLQDAMLAECAEAAPFSTTETIETMREAQFEITRLRAENQQLKKKFDTLYDAYTKLRNRPIQLVGSSNE